MSPDLNGPWLRTSEAVVQLGMSRETLMRRKHEGFFRQGEHWVSTGPSRTAAILWCVEACRKQQGQWAAPKGGGQ